MPQEHDALERFACAVADIDLRSPTDVEWIFAHRRAVIALAIEVQAWRQREAEGYAEISKAIAETDAALAEVNHE